jgi:transposase-like protein
MRTGLHQPLRTSRRAALALSGRRGSEQSVFMSEVARAVELNTNVLYRWRREFLQGAGQRVSARTAAYPCAECGEPVSDSPPSRAPQQLLDF